MSINNDVAKLRRKKSKSKIIEKWKEKFESDLKFQPQLSS